MDVDVYVCMYVWMCVWMCVCHSDNVLLATGY